MVFGDGTERALTVDDLPRIVADVSRSEPERVAFRTGDQLVTYGQLDALLQQLDAAMGGALGPESLVPLVLADLVPEMLGADGALDRLDVEHEARLAVGRGRGQQLDTADPLGRAALIRHRRAWKVVIRQFKPWK